MKTATFESSTVYKLSQDWANYYSQVNEYCPEGKRYEYARSVKSAKGNHVADCWIVDEHGKRHPGYSTSPVPMNINALEKV